VSKVAADATYVRTVNGTPVGPDGDVVVPTGEVPDEVIADAVTTELAGRDLVEGADSRLPQTAESADAHWGVRDSKGREQLVANTDGTVDIPLPNLAGMPVRAAESPLGYIKGTRDAAGRVAEDVIDEHGQVPQWVLDRWGDRAGWGAVPPTPKPRVHVIVVAGQSNSAVSDTNPPAGTFGTDPRLKKWDRATNTIVPVAPPRARSARRWAAPTCPVARPM